MSAVSNTPITHIDMFRIFWLVCGSLSCCMCASFSSDSKEKKAVAMVRRGKVAKDDLVAVLKRTAAIRLEWIDRSSPSEMIDPARTKEVVKILREDSRSGVLRRLDADVDFFRMPPDLVFLDIHGKEAGRVSLARVCSASDAQRRSNAWADLVLPDEQYYQLIELLKYADTGTNRSIRVWCSKGKVEFEYVGIRYASLEQLKRHADLKNAFTVHLMHKVASDECWMLYREMERIGFRIEDMTVPFDNGHHGTVLPVGLRELRQCERLGAVCLCEKRDFLRL
ncbi:hypothetical protein [Akkermansia glycaniphila]|nr:hypothetical protein [Akkermansia glycaniphila]